MAEIELTRTPRARRLYALEGVGTLRLQGFASRRATAEAGCHELAHRSPRVSGSGSSRPPTRPAQRW